MEFLFGLAFGAVAIASIMHQFYSTRGVSDFDEDVLMDELVKRRTKRNIEVDTERTTEREISKKADTHARP